MGTMRPLNFLHITTFYPPYSFGGDAMYIHRLAHALGDQGHHVDVVHCVDSYHLLHPAPPPISFREHPNVMRHGLKSGYGSLSPLLSQQTGRPFLKMTKLRELIAARKYDVVHFHNTSLFGPTVLKIDVPDAVKIYTTHEHWLICPMHVLWKFNERACERPECFKCTLLARRPPQVWRYTGLLDRCSRSVDQFVSPSRFTAQMHAQRGFARPVEHLPYFIDHVNKPADTGERVNANPYFLFVGRLEKIKGLQTLFPLWRELDADLLVAGTGNYEGELRAAAAGNPRIKFLGALSQAQLDPLYRNATACIVPSITYETFGMISIEAFARRTPMIVRNLGALPEAIEDSGGGFTYRTDAELVQAAKVLLKSDDLRCELGQKGYEGFLRYWCPEAHMKLYFGYLQRAARKTKHTTVFDEAVDMAMSNSASA
jgi:glycosyltransferase involved in cell wall biosynthesis